MPVVSVMPGRKVTRAASVTTSGDASRPSRLSAAAQKLAATAATGATIGSEAGGSLRPASAIAPTHEPDQQLRLTASRQPPPSTGVSAAPASA